MLINRHTQTIEWGDCDPAGIEFYPRYFAYFDVCTGKLFAKAHFGEEVVIESTITEFRRSSFDVHHRILKGDALAVEGFETRVWVGKDPENPDKIKSQPIPQEVLQAFNV